MAIPFKELRYGAYARTGADGQPLIMIPPKDDSSFRAWFARGLGPLDANNCFATVFGGYAGKKVDTELIFDSKGVSCQLEDLGALESCNPNATMTLKNHDRSPNARRTVRVGFFVDSELGMVYSSTDDPTLSGGLVTLEPGEAKTVRLGTKEPNNLSSTGNRFWFDVRTVGEPEKVIFRMPPTPFHDQTARLYGKDISWQHRLYEDVDRMRMDRPGPSKLETVNLAIPISAAKAPIEHALLTIVAAQKLYRQIDWDGDGLQEYAPSFRGTNSLYEIQPGRADLNFIPAAMAMAEENGTDAQSFHGYWFRILKAQGAAAEGGAKSYVTNGSEEQQQADLLPLSMRKGAPNSLTEGFAMLAYPAVYAPGQKCYLANQVGQLFEADLGKNTGELVKKIDRFNPAAEQGWKKQAQ